jgi:hypothetical protein
MTCPGTQGTYIIWRWGTMNRSGSGGAKYFQSRGECREPFGDPRVKEDVRPFTVEEVDRLAQVFHLLDTWDRARRSTKERKAA